MSYKTETRSNPRKRTKRKPTSIESRSKKQTAVPNIKDVETKISHLRENLKIAAAKCRDDIRSEQTGRQTTYGGAMARLNLWKRLQNPTEENKRKIGDRNMDHAINVLSSLSKLRSTARQMEVDSVCAESPRTLRLIASRSLHAKRDKPSTPPASFPKPSKESTRETSIKKGLPDRCRSEGTSPRYSTQTRYKPAKPSFRNVVTPSYSTVGYTPNNYKIENRGYSTYTPLNEVRVSPSENQGYSTYTPLNEVRVSPSNSTHSAPTRIVTYTQQPTESKWVTVSSLNQPTESNWVTVSSLDQPTQSNWVTVSSSHPGISRSYDLPSYGNRNQGSTQHVLSRIRSWPVLDSDDYLGY